MIKDFFSPEGKIQQHRLFWIIFGIIVLLWAVVGLPYSGTVAKKQFDKFNSSSIHGRITEIHSTKIGVGLSVNDILFDFYPIADGRSNDFKSFIALAAIDDSIVKQPYADTLYLFTRNKLYKYTFKKF